ncbi:MAG: hypothetical protein KF779_18890 [Hyphomonadaceae bacterium]|nr:hypothetical protein [Hyphomonadaceae bacterium]
MSTEEIVRACTAEVGGYVLATYRDKKTGVLNAANGVSALGALAGIFAQVQARAMLRFGVIPQTETTLVEISTKAGDHYYFGDAINACLLEGSENSPSFWNLSAGAANDPKIGDKIKPQEIARRAAKEVGSPDFGRPRIDTRYRVTEPPAEAVRKHGPWLLARFLELNLDPLLLMYVFGSVAQSFAQFAAGEIKDVQTDSPMQRTDIVRLYMESAIPSSKLDLRAVDMAIEWKA